MVDYKIVLDFKDAEFKNEGKLDFLRWLITDDFSRKVLKRANVVVEFSFVKDGNVIDVFEYHKTANEPFYKGFTEDKNHCSIVHEMVATTPIVLYRILNKN